MIALVLALQSMPGAPALLPWYGEPWRVYSSPALHVGVRPCVAIASDEIAIAVSLQVSRVAGP